MDRHKLRHPTPEQIIRAQHQTIVRHGGSHGLRDLGLLMSALAMPRQTYGGELLHAGVAEMAAAYLYHLCMNHPFVDGNKRIGFLAALMFLRINNYGIKGPKAEAEAITLRVAASQCSKPDLSKWFVERLVAL